jgi:hypothetical protein
MAIEGYTSHTSVAQGGGIGLHVDNTPAKADEAVRVTVARLGADAPTGFTDTFAARHHPTPPDASERGCGWPRAYTLAIPCDWPSGFYTATLTNADGDTTDLNFVVRARVPGSASKILVCIPVTTFQAYNEWGGDSLYGTPTARRLRRVSFDRPGGSGPSRPRHLIRWLAKRGIEVEMCTSVDLHEGADLLAAYQLFVSTGHDEYWTKEMRDHVESFVESGGNVAFLSGNVAYWQARLEDGGRTLVCYRDAIEDPLAGVDDSRVTVEWASAPVDRPENRMTGVGFRFGAGSWVVEGAWRAAEYRVNFPEHWVFEGTGLAFGQTFARGSVGYEVDAADIVFEQGIARATGRGGTPGTFVVLAVADLRRWRAEGQGGMGTMGIYRSVGTVFTAASADWAETLETSPEVDRITRNVIARLSHPYPDEGWERVGDAPAVVAMTAVENKLFAVTSDGALLFREPVGQNLRWRRVGEAPGIVALSSGEAVSGRPVGIYLLARSGALFFRDPVLDEVVLQAAGSAPDVVGIAASDVYIFGITRAGRLVARPMEGVDVAWKDVGDAAGIAVLAAGGRKLWGVTAEGRVLHREPVIVDAPWEPSAIDAPDVVALVGEGGKLFAATRAGVLLRRDAYARPPAR